jgi:hypothetical protein
MGASIGRWLVLNGVTCTAAGTQTSNAVKIPSNADGNFSLKYSMGAGGGTAKFEALFCDTETGTFIEPAAMGDIVTGCTASTSGIVSFSPPVIRGWIKIRMAETASATSIVGTARLMMQ